MISDSNHADSGILFLLSLFFIEYALLIVFIVIFVWHDSCMIASLHEFQLKC